MLSRLFVITTFLCCSLVFLSVFAQLAHSQQADTAELTRRAELLFHIEGGQSLSVGELEDFINSQSPALRDYYSAPEHRKELFDERLRLALMEKYATSKKYSTHEEVIQKEKEFLVRELLLDKIDKPLRASAFPEAELKSFYTSHIADFSKAEYRRASHMLVADKTKALALLREAQKGDVRAFRELAQQHSIDMQTRMRGGDLLYFPKDEDKSSQNPQVDPALRKAAFAVAELGELYAKPVQVGEDWSIVKLTGLRPAEKQSFAQAKAKIQGLMFSQKRQQAIESLLARLRKSSTVQVNEKLLKAIDLRDAEIKPGQSDKHHH
ncbi:MAG: peptidyl-prolyl cis-trans isomerase [Myxococcales bacterium]|nr:MAG: peptidyl-prolyl cis-trans isomerase [Myxococcales bacterium]